MCLFHVLVGGYLSLPEGWLASSAPVDILWHCWTCVGCPVCVCTCVGCPVCVHVWGALCVYMCGVPCLRVCWCALLVLFLACSVSLKSGAMRSMWRCSGLRSRRGGGPRRRYPDTLATQLHTTCRHVSLYLRTYLAPSTWS